MEVCDGYRNVSACLSFDGRRALGCEDNRQNVTTIFTEQQLGMIIAQHLLAPTDMAQHRD